MWRIFCGLRPWIRVNKRPGLLCEVMNSCDSTVFLLKWKWKKKYSFKPCSHVCSFKKYTRKQVVTWRQTVHHGRLRNNQFIYLKPQSIPVLEQCLLCNNHHGPSVAKYDQFFCVAVSYMGPACTYVRNDSAFQFRCEGIFGSFPMLQSLDDLIDS